MASKSIGLPVTVIRKIKAEDAFCSFAYIYIFDFYILWCVKFFDFKEMENDGLDLPRLFERSKEALTKAYCPYSNFPVGAAVLGENGNIYTG